MEVFRMRRHVGAVHALTLQAQHHDDVGAAQAFAHVARPLHAEPFDPRRQQRRWRDHAHAGAERVEQDDVGTRHPRMQNVAADRDGEVFDLAFPAADGECIEQRLGRMLVLAVAGVDH